MKKIASIVFPHQLFENNPAVDNGGTIFLVEEYLFFRQYKFHKQKLKFHRATMKFYEGYLKSRGHEVRYVESTEEISDVRRLIPHIIGQGFEEIRYCDVSDNWLGKRIKKYDGRVSLREIESPLFINSKAELSGFFEGKKKYFQTKFYIGQRKKLGILIEGDAEPAGGKWSFDAENRKKYPKTKTAPKVEFPKHNDFVKEAEEYVGKHFSDNYGDISGPIIYPTTYAESRKWLQEFFVERFKEFGDYEDAIVAEEKILNHSVLTPMLNVGLLSPLEVVESAVEFADENDVPINSLEGFVRQIIGWREFIRGVYEFAGSRERTTNYWGFSRKIPETFWERKTGIEPLDITIGKVLETGYCHHIERLMVIGNFMLLCEFDPDDVYRWFMELFVDAYDWVMVPNVYGMSQFADGGLMATKPYISGSNYLKKMSDFANGDWQKIWDGLFWRFMHVHRDFFQSNPRLGMLIRMFDKMPEEKRKAHIDNAERYLEQLGD